MAHARNILTIVLAHALAAGPWTPALHAADHAAALSLQPLIEEARRRNPELAAARKRWEAAQQRVPLSKALPAPRIGIEFEEIPRGSIKVNQASLMYQLIQALPFPGKLSLRHQVAIKEAQVAAMEFKQMEWEVITQLKAAYYDLFLTDREVDIQEEQLAWLRQAAAVAQAKYATGRLPQADVLRAQAELLQAENARRILAHSRQATEAHLNHLLNQPVHQPVGRPEPIRLAPVRFSLDELWLLATTSQPELLMFRYAAERAAASYRLAKRELLPDLETMAELRDPAMGPVGPWDLTLAIAIPFWFWTKWKYGIKAALYDRDSAQAAAQAMENAIARRIHEHWHQAQAAYATAKLCQDSLIDLSRQAAASALAAYQGGRGSFMEVLAALQAASEQQRTYYRDLVQFEQHLAMLEQSVGVALREEPAAGGAS